MSKKATRLINQFKPEHYDLSLTLNKAELKFSGTVKVSGIKVGRPSKRFTFHQKNLTVTSAKLVQISKNETKEIPVSRILHHKAYDEVRIHTDELVRNGAYEVTLAFNGTITEEMVGIYPSYYVHNGTEEIIIATQFESHHAREAFPCIDEPSAKATFSLSLTTDTNETVLSNTPIRATQTKANKTITSFETTPRMSTYLLAFVTGNLHGVSATTKNGVTVTSWASKARAKQELEYANNEAVRLLDFYTEYFGISYPLPKCDQVALPDFDSGAMENWGLITYREIALLTDPANRSISNEQYVSLVVAHELSHQWFGNLVTMEWWDDLWLNESFASFMEHLALDKLHPDWHQWELYTASDVMNTTNRDIYKDIQPVGVQVTDPDLIETLFDPGIVYAKGGRLLKMLRDFIGDDAFRKGLQNYFKKHAYANTTREDLWSALSESSQKNISQLMTPWITQPGMPILHVNQQGKTLHLSQKRYVLDHENDKTLWPIPLLAAETLPTNVLAQRTKTQQLADDAFVLLNHRASGHYFTHYENDAHREFIVSSLKTKHLPAESRINALNDIFMLARKGEASLVDGLTMILPLKEENRDSVWVSISRIIGTANQLTEGHDKSEQYIKKLKVALAINSYQRLGWDTKPEDNTNTIQLRHTMISLMLGGENQEAISTALQRYNEAQQPSRIDSEIRNSILGAVVRHGNSEDHEKLIQMYPEASPDLQLDITSALTSTKDPHFAQSVLNRALGKNGFVRTQDIMRWLALFLRNRHTRLIAWEFIQSQWQWLETVIGNSKSFDFLPVYAASTMNSREWQQKYHTFFEPKLENKVLERNIKIGFADIAARIAWRERDEAAIKRFLQETAKTL